MSFYFPKDNILFTDNLLSLSKQEIKIRKQQKPIIKSYDDLIELLKLQHLIEIAPKTYLINGDIHKSATHLGTAYFLATVIGISSPEMLCKKNLKSETDYFQKKLKPTDITYNPKNYKYNINNKGFNTLPEIAKYFNINIDQLRCRIYKQNMTIEEAINHKPKPINRKKHKNTIITKDGENFSSVYAICKKYNLSQITVERLLQNNQSIKQYKLKNNRSIIINNVEYKSLSEYCRKHNLNNNTVSSRLRRGFSIEDAINPNLKRKTHKKHKPHVHIQPITIDNITYNNIKQACQHYNISYNTYKTRRKKGWSIEKAITTPLLKSKT